jgi:hypothetical protein
VIDILTAIESVVEAATGLDARRRQGECVRRESVTVTALALAVPAGRQPRAAAALLERLRTDPVGTARALDSTLGAVVVWRAVERAERAGESPLRAADAGLQTALAYLELTSDQQFATLGVDRPGRCAALAILEIQARLALSGLVEETA